MAVKKSELYSSLWKMCDELRGGMDASQYKDFALVLLFVKYVSDRYAGKANSLIEVPEARRKNAISYQEYFDKIVELTKQAKHLASSNSYPATVKSTAQTAIRP
ncbi:type I restriction-modification system subunit M N-terminal domain-containing protein [Rosistilla oblonga]|uniref:type I restriction-modification system subunit M N-terminal domain-containing protein n=1 Tax=Rosistilla oblonga TaxID=2527990 RepID=UPI003A980DC6